MTVLLRDLADTSAAVAGTSARLGKVGLLADVLGRADPDEAAAAVAFLSGELRQRQIGVGWATLREAPPPADSPTLRVGEVDATFEEVGRQSGAGSQASREPLVGGPVRARSEVAAVPAPEFADPREYYGLPRERTVITGRESRRREPPRKDAWRSRDASRER